MMPCPKPPAFTKEGPITELVKRSDLHVTDKQFLFVNRPLSEKDFENTLRAKEKYEIENDITVNLEACQFEKGFWKDPWSILSVATFTIFPLPNYFTCRTTVEIRNRKTGVTQRAENLVTYYSGIGVLTPIAGLVTPIYMYQYKLQEAIKLIKEAQSFKDGITTSKLNP